MATAALEPAAVVVPVVTPAEEAPAALFNMDPVQGKLMARAIAEGLERVDPEGASVYREGLARFTAILDEKIPVWLELAKPLRGRKAVSYHQDLVYFAHRFGLVLEGTIETRPGVPATPRHVEELIARMKAEDVRLVIREVAYEMPLAETIAVRTGGRVATVATLTGRAARSGELRRVHRGESARGARGGWRRRAAIAAQAARMDGPALVVERADLGYAGQPVLHQVTLEIRPAEFVAVLGPNGSGKTTLLRSLLGFLPPLSGSVVRARGARIGYVPQRETLDSHYPLSGAEVALFGT